MKVVGRWALGLFYILAVATIWIAASFVVQSVVDAGVPPFLITYICNSLFLVYIPLVEIGRFMEDRYGTLLFWLNRKDTSLQGLGDSEEAILLRKNHASTEADSLVLGTVGGDDLMDNTVEGDTFGSAMDDDVSTGLDSKGRWTRTRVAKASLLICPFWFLAQLTFNLSLKYTTVTSNTILSSASSLFTFLVSLVFLGEKFTWLKLISVLLCMGGTVVVSLGDSKSGSSAVAPNPVLGDFLALFSAAFYAVYITLIRKKLPDDEEGKSSPVSMAQFLGFLGLFNLLIFLPLALVLNFAKLEPFDKLSWEQFSLIVGKGFLDNVLSDYLWAKAVLLTTTTVASAGLAIQVPLAAVVDILTGNAPQTLDYIGAAAVLVGFAGISIPSDTFSKSVESNLELNNGNAGTIEMDGYSSR